MIERLTKWLGKRKLYRAFPELRELDRKIVAAKTSHRQVIHLYAKKRAILHRALGMKRSSAS